MKAKQSAARRRKLEKQTTSRSSVDPAGELLWREVRVLLDEEIARLPETYRSALVLCCLEKVSQAEAAERLGLKERTVANRLAAARKRLQNRLARRGVGLAALLAATALTTETTSALPAGLMPTAIKAAMALGERLAGAVPPSVAALMENHSPILSFGKAKFVVALVLAMGLAVG